MRTQPFAADGVLAVEVLPEDGGQDLGALLAAQERPGERRDLAVDAVLRSDLETGVET